MATAFGEFSLHAGGLCKEWSRQLQLSLLALMTMLMCSCFSLLRSWTLLMCRLFLSMAAQTEQARSSRRLVGGWAGYTVDTHAPTHHKSNCASLQAFLPLQCL